MNSRQFHCGHCGNIEFCRPTQVLAKLQSMGMLRRVNNPEPDVLEQLLQSSLGRMQCVACGHAGLTAEIVQEDEWDDGRRCERCGGVIARERLEVLPHSTRCADCAANQESSTDDEDVEYCPRCGSIMQLKLKQGRGISRYQMICPGCR